MPLKKKPKCILVIDDDEGSRYLMRKIFEGAGYSVDESGNASQGLEKAVERMPQLILLDLVMAGSTGFDFLKKRMDTQPHLSQIPVIVVSSLNDKPSVYKAISLGASDYVIKPINTKTLLQKASKHIRDQRFLKYAFPSDARKTVTLDVLGKIVAGTESGFFLEVPIKIAPETKLDVQSTILSELENESLVFKSLSRTRGAGEPGRYLNEIAMVGMSLESIRKIKMRIMGGRRK